MLFAPYFSCRWFLLSLRYGAGEPLKTYVEEFDTRKSKIRDRPALKLFWSCEWEVSTATCALSFAQRRDEGTRRTPSPSNFLDQVQLTVGYLVRKRGREETSASSSRIWVCTDGTSQRRRGPTSPWACPSERKQLLPGRECTRQCWNLPLQYPATPGFCEEPPSTEPCSSLRASNRVTWPSYTESWKKTERALPSFCLTNLILLLYPSRDQNLICNHKKKETVSWNCFSSKYYTTP